MNTDYYVYLDENDNLIANGKDVNQVAKEIAEKLFPEEPTEQIISLSVKDTDDSVYITGKKANMVSEMDLCEIVDDCGFDAEYYIETEFFGNGEYRAIFHKN